MRRDFRRLRNKKTEKQQPQKRTWQDVPGLCRFRNKCAKKTQHKLLTTELKTIVFFGRVGEMHRDFRRRQPVQDQLFQRKWDTCVLTEQQNELDSGQIHELSE